MILTPEQLKELEKWCTHSRVSLSKENIQALRPCEGEQYFFEEWAKKERMDMTEHPLHYLFMDPKTSAARDGWKAGVAYAMYMLGHNPNRQKVFL